MVSGVASCYAESTRILIKIPNVLAIVAAIPIVYLVLVAPWYGRYRYQRLLTQLASDVPCARLLHYKRGVARQVLHSGLVFLLPFLTGISGESLGLTGPRSWPQAAELLGMLLSAVAISIAIFRYRGEWQFKTLLRTAGALLPISVAEQRWFAAVSIGAGVSEELLYRGFFFWYCWTTFPKLQWWAGVLICSVGFGFAHLYQGWRGMAGSTAMGFLFGMLYIETGSLLVPIVVHAAVDLRILAIINPQRRERLAKTDWKGPAGLPTARSATAG